jgi:hypothetical protein
MKTLATYFRGGQRYTHIFNGVVYKDQVQQLLLKLGMGCTHVQSVRYI